MLLCFPILVHGDLYLNLLRISKAYGGKLNGFLFKIFLFLLYLDLFLGL